MNLQPVNLLGAAYRDGSLPFSAQDTVNWIYTPAQTEGTRTPGYFRGAPGLTLFGNYGTAACRGLHEVEGRAFGVIGTNARQFFADGTSRVLGNVPGAGMVDIAHNQIAGGSEVAFVNGSSGYIWNTVKETFEKITDDAFPGAITADYLNQRFVMVEPAGRYGFVSELANGMSYNGIRQFQSEASPDRIVRAVVSQFEVVVFNTTTTEFFAGTDSANQPLASTRRMIQVGCSAKNSVVKLDNTIFFLDNFGRVCRIVDGYGAKPVSTAPIERAIANCNWAQAIGFAYQSEGHQIYYLTFPDGLTWGLDVVTQEWHRRASFGLDRWRVNAMIRWNGKWLAGDFANGNLYLVDWDAYTENGAPLVCERVSATAHSNQSRVVANCLELLLDTGHGDTPDHAVMFDYSDDGGRNFSNARTRSLGATGEYARRVKFLRLGSFRNRCVRVRVSSPCRRDLLGAVVQLEPTDG